MFRSISVPGTVRQKREEGERGMNAELSDAMDVLSMLGPRFVHCGPSPSQLEIVARRSLKEVNPQTLIQRKIAKVDLTVLVRLLLRLRVRKEKLGSYGSHLITSNLINASSVEQELTESLAGNLVSKESDEINKSDQFLRAIELTVSHFKSPESNLASI